MNGRKRSRVPRHVPLYSAIAVTLSSTTEPLSEDFRAHTIERLRAAVQAMTTDEQPTVEDWRVCCDAVNAMETIVKKEWATDEHGLQPDALLAMALAGQRLMDGKPLRLDEVGATAMRHLIVDYEACMAGLSEKSMRIVFNETDRRTHDLRHGINRNPHDTHVVIGL
jgi:hypothetical protein